MQKTFQETGGSTITNETSKSFSQPNQDKEKNQVPPNNKEKKPTDGIKS